MHFHYDITLLILSVLACSIATLILFDFIDRLYTSSAQKRKILLPTFALIIGTSIWANHIMLSFAFEIDLGKERNVFPTMSFIAWSFATLVAFITISAASKRHLKLTTALFSGLVAGGGTLGMYFFDSASMRGFATVPPADTYLIIVSLIFTIGMITASIFTLSWLKTYSGANQIPVKLVVALAVTFGIIAIHYAFDRAFEHHEIITSSTIYNQFMGIIVALVFLSLILMSFILILFFEKHGKQLFTFSFFNRKDESSVALQNHVDSLTKLPNRAAFQRHLEGAIKRSTSNNTKFALAYIDLDHFKPINDQYGHQVGDTVLTIVAERLNTAIRGCDFVARIGGDEFVAIIEEIKSTQEAIPIIERVLKLIREPFHIDNMQFDISCSIGVAIHPKDGQMDKLMACADAAMYKAKENGKNQFKFYDAYIESASEQLLEMQSDLCLALENEEFFLEFQPKFDCKTQAIVGAEALIRWNHPSKGVVLPKTFLPAAERFGLINQISDWVLQECCQTISKAKQAGFDLNISINLSSQQFRYPNLVENITDVIKQHNVDACRLTFEIKETLAIKNQAQFKLLLNMFKEAGIRVALDDFGLHPFSLNYLQDLNVDELKLDRSFISTINQNKGSKPLIDAVIQLAHALDLSVVAEGVETKIQQETLTELGCNHMQGYHLSKPISAESLFNHYPTTQEIRATSPQLKIVS